MADYSWPTPDKRKLLGTRQLRVDAPVKVTGRAKYTYDLVRPNMLYGIMVRSPHAHARITAIDTSAAEKMPGVKAVWVIKKPGTPNAEVQWGGEEVVALAATDEHIAQQAAKAVKITYEPLEHLVVSEPEPPADLGPAEGPLDRSDLYGMFDNQEPDEKVIGSIKKNGLAFQPSDRFLQSLKEDEVSDNVIAALKEAKVVPPDPNRKAAWFKKSAATTNGDPDGAFNAADTVVSEGVYGVPVITHCCLETHGTVTEWPSQDHCNVFISTQNVSGIAEQMAEPLKTPASNIHVHMDYIGGGFGSKFGPDRWGIVCAELSRKAGAPVKMMLDRRAELEVAGARPSAYARVKCAATKDGKLTAWDSLGWGTGGPSTLNSPPIPYVWEIPNKRTAFVSVRNNIGPARAWRAPNHPQAAALTMTALDDLAAKLNMDPLDFFLKNIDMTGTRSSYYKEELLLAADMIGWKKLWKPRDENYKSTSSVKRGLGLSMHTWGGRGHESHCDFSINPDGSVSIKMGSQDLGTGTRTAIIMIAADTLGVPMSQINLQIGDTNFPKSGGSGGSTTIGGVSSSVRRASVDALEQLMAKVAPALGTQPENLESVNGVIRVKGTPSKSLTWKQACAKIGATAITSTGANPDKSKPPDLTNSGVAGVQMADVSVDTETGIVKVNKMVAVQDCGYVISLTTAESQVYGALIMGITYALYEEKIMDQQTGRMLNPNMEHYRLAGIGDIGELQVHMMQTPEHEKRGVIGLGEPPVVSPGATLSNAVANAIGTRVPFLPLTPDRVLDALGRMRVRA
jgi:xanthine dehydrogenase YagR molybdenum-binding subunit